MTVLYVVPDEALQLLQEHHPVVIDVRDPASFGQGHLPAAIQLNNENVEDFLSETDRSRPVLVYCFHGISSRGAAAWLSEKGFQQVYSLEGGFEAWRWNYPVER